jgi:UDP-N-acetyl-D-glucosamine dehydrogenase
VVLEIRVLGRSAMTPVERKTISIRKPPKRLDEDKGVPQLGPVGRARAERGSSDASMATAETTTRTTRDLVSRITDRHATVAVIGQGYVGLSLASAAAGTGFDLVGIDVDEDRLAQLSAGVLAVPGVDERMFSAGIASGLLHFSSDQSRINRADVIAICVPTPLNGHVPDLSFVQAACDTVARHLTPGTLVVMESTTYPGTTEDVVRPLLESSGLTAGRDFLLAYCPERIDPGNRDFDFEQIPRVVGGVDETSTRAAALFYEQFVNEVVTVSSCRTAELAKLLENTFRHVNIALVNETAMLCHETGIDVWEVIEAAATKPFGFMPFHPGPGVGGHCIPLDPTYLAWQMRRDVGHQFRILEQSQDINAQMPEYVGSRISDALNDAGKAVNGTPVLILGVAYKPGVGDIRESPSLKVMQWLARRGAVVSFHDPYIETVTIDGHRIERTDLDTDILGTVGCVALLTPHRTYDLDRIAHDAPLVFDARNAYGDGGRPNVVRL